MNQVLKAANVFITKTYLISAYDIYYEYVPKPKDLFTVDLMFLDSGGYEISGDYDLSTVSKFVHWPNKWNTENLQTVWNLWPDHLPVVLVTYDHPDHRKPVVEQLRDAKQHILEKSNHLHSFLLKPETHEEHSLKISLQVIQEHAKDLDGFQLIGVTEKELGSSPLERMLHIATLRQALDNASISIPIHIFGALDPISVCLYFAAGAEIFDGLTWFRYAYRSGQCVYTHNNATMAYGLDINDHEARVRTIMDNLQYLNELEISLRHLAKTGDWDHLNDNRDFVRSATKKMMRHLKRDDQ